MPASDTSVPAELASEHELIREAAREAGQIALRFFGRDPEVWMKIGDSPVSEADFAVDAFLREALLAARPDYGWLSEETVDDAARLRARRTFVVDPIDGTRAFLAGRRTWCVSIAIVEEGQPLVGVLECPAREETFEATLGGGAFKNGRRLAVDPDGARRRVAGPKNMISRLSREVEPVPYIPSLACRLAMVADRSIDATFVKPNSHDWDLAAADLILSEAGGRVLDHSALPLSYAGSVIARGALAAGSGALLEELSAVVRAAHA